jgi:hypothetical protein
MKRNLWLSWFLTLGMALGMALGWAVPAAQAADCAVGGFVVNKRMGIVEQLLAFSTNGTFFTTYAGAITSGTSGCSNSGIVKEEYEQRIFVTANYDALSLDLAQGQGQYGAALAALLGCRPELRGEFVRVAQGRFGALVTGGPEQADALLAALKDELRVHPALSQGCSRLA